VKSGCSAKELGDWRQFDEVRFVVESLLFGFANIHLLRLHAWTGWFARAVIASKDVDPTFPTLTIHDLRHTAVLRLLLSCRRGRARLVSLRCLVSARGEPSWT
jgi:integrase